MPKFLKITKTVLYIAAGILIILFHKNMMPYVAFLVAGVVLAYALEELAFRIARRQFPDIAESMIQILLAILLIYLHDDFVKVCVIWGVWSVIREGRDLHRALTNIKKYKLAVLDILESVVVIPLSILIILRSKPVHAQLHLILLGIELILEVLFPLLEDLVQARKARKNT